MRRLLQMLAIALVSMHAVAADARDPVEYRIVALDAFMQEPALRDIPFGVPVPVEYEAVALDDAPVSYVYWMRESDAPRARKTGDLPGKAGHMYGKVSLDVGYDKEEDLFLGAEEAESLARAHEIFTDLKIERFDHPSYPALVFSATIGESNRRVYAVYVATGIGSNTVYIALRPKGNKREVGEFLWAELRRGLLASNYVPRPAVLGD